MLDMFTLPPLQMNFLTDFFFNLEMSLLERFLKF